MSTPDEYDRRCAAWVRQKFGVTPDLGSVEFGTDCAAYASGGWAQVDVGWSVNGVVTGRTLIDDAWQADLSGIIRELLAVDLAADPETAGAILADTAPSVSPEAEV